MKAEIKDEGFDINAIVEQLPKEEANKKKYQEEGIAKYVTDNLDLYRLEEEKELISEEYDYVPGGTDGKEWRRRGSDKPPGGMIKDNGRRFNTWHSDDSIAKKYGIFERTSWQEIFYRKGDGDYSKTVDWIKENYPDIYKGWQKQSIEEDFLEFKEEIEPEEVEPVIPNYIDLDMSEFPRFNELVQTFNRCSHYFNPEFGFISALAFGSMASNLDYTLGGMYSNLQMDIFAETSIGKQALLNSLRELFKFLGIEDLLAPPYFASDIANYTFMSKYNILLGLEDETGIEAKIQKEGGNPHKAGVKKFNLLVHSNTGREMECPVSNERLQKTGRVVIHRPFLTNIKISTPTHFKQIYGSDSLTDGSLNRSLVFNIPIRYRKENLGDIPNFLNEVEKIPWIGGYKKIGEAHRKFREEIQMVMDQLAKYKTAIAPLEKNEFRIACELDRLAMFENILSEDFDLDSLPNETSRKAVRDRLLLDYLRGKIEGSNLEIGNIHRKYEGLFLPKEILKTERLKEYFRELKTICNDQYNTKKNMIGVYGRNLMHICGMALSIIAIEKPETEDEIIRIIEKSKSLVDAILAGLERTINAKYTGATILDKNVTSEEVEVEVLNLLKQMVENPDLHCTTPIKSRSRILAKEHNAVLKQRVNRYLKKGNIETQTKRSQIFTSALNELKNNCLIVEKKILDSVCYVILK